MSNTPAEFTYFILASFNLMKYVNTPAEFTYFIRLKLARLQAELSRNMYSEQGFEALMRAVFLLVCHLLMVVSNCMPGSPHNQVASAIFFITSRALWVSTGSWPFTLWVVK